MSPGSARGGIQAESSLGVGLAACGLRLSNVLGPPTPASVDAGGRVGSTSLGAPKSIRALGGDDTGGSDSGAPVADARELGGVVLCPPFAREAGGVDVAGGAASRALEVGGAAAAGRAVATDDGRGRGALKLSLIHI